MMRRVYLGVLWVVLLTLAELVPSATASQIMDLDGAWFSCEFAHSQIAPNDGCRMLDDDGFLIVGGTIEHIKVRDSRETACRHNRMGNCFRRDRPKVIVERGFAGTFRPTTEGFQVEYWGCAQNYKMQEQEGYFEVLPVDGLCYWTSDKRYFLARFNGNVQIAKEDTDSLTFSSER